ncbi:MAG: hypothetical protein LBK66_05335 [Spirochaetaceae bacterium]|jgi:hypothetical protein|nr:hypothetical protein [Spirochaetaceae bacterium]
MENFKNKSSPPPPAKQQIPTTRYVSPSGGNDDNNGETAGAPFQTVQAALAKVATDYNGSWPGKNTANEQSAAIVLLDTLTVDGDSKIEISGNGLYPPLILRAQTPVPEGNVTLAAAFDGPCLRLGKA